MTNKTWCTVERSGLAKQIQVLAEAGKRKIDLVVKNCILGSKNFILV